MKDAGPARPGRARPGRRQAAGAPWVEADALVTLGQLSERAAGSRRRSTCSPRRSSRPARRAVLGVELRAGVPAGPGAAGVGRPGRGAAHRASGRAARRGGRARPRAVRLRPAVPALPGALRRRRRGITPRSSLTASTIRVTSPSEARLSAMALFIDVARGRPAVAERRAWLEPFFGGTGSPSTSPAACWASTRTGTATARPRWPSPGDDPRIEKLYGHYGPHRDQACGGGAGRAGRPGQAGPRRRRRRACPGGGGGCARPGRYRPRGRRLPAAP